MQAVKKKLIVNWKYIILALTTAFLYTQTLQAQQIDARLKADSTWVSMGDAITLTLAVDHVPGLSLQWPKWEKELGGLEIISYSNIDSSHLEGKIRKQQEISLIAFDTGSFKIPPVQIEYTIGNGDYKQSISSNPLIIDVDSVVVDLAQGIKPVKGILDAPFTIQEALPFIILGLLVIGLIVGGIWYFRRRKPKPEVVEVKPLPKIPPHETAMRKLALLEEKKLWQKGEFKAYYIELTEVLREYLEGVFDVAALESTTGEILTEMSKHSLPMREYENLKNLLQMADLAKFAKFKPGDQENLNNMEVARSFIRETKHITLIPEPDLEEELEEKSNIPAENLERGKEEVT